ncbi:insulin-like 3 (Leydig cell) [Channa argus]|uniref:insulin-like 3 (Leydig cell) n=1 Tax=Channa argus TaxID=215402 RepID=UPI003523082F
MLAARGFVCLMMMLVAGMCADHTQDRIKMCGRELIRLAVSSCGNTWLGRNIPDTELGQHQDIPHWELDASTEGHQATGMVHIPAESGRMSYVSSLAPHWYPFSSRIRRATGEISDICCEKGCSMKELIKFC